MMKPNLELKFGVRTLRQLQVWWDGMALGG